MRKSVTFMTRYLMMNLTSSEVVTFQILLRWSGHELHDKEGFRNLKLSELHQSDP